MAYRLKPGPRIGKEIVRVIKDQITRAIQAVEGRNIAFPERIHVARTSCKRIRAALRLVRTIKPRIWDRENARFRAAARELAPLRDAAVLPRTFSGLLKQAGEPIDAKAFASVRRAILANRRRVLGDSANNDRVISCFIDQMREAAHFFAKLRIEDDTHAVVTTGVGETYRRARQAWRRAEASPSTGVFHNYRKRAKSHGYHCRLFRCAWPAVMREWQGELSALGNLLGDEHDLAVLDGWLDENVAVRRGNKSVVHLRRVIRSRRHELRKRSLLLGARLFAEKPEAVSRRMLIWWRAATGLDENDRSGGQGRR